MLFLNATAAYAGVPNLDWLQICMRLFCAMIVGIVIGTEREYTHRPAGMRTHILVTLGACSVMITGQLIFSQYHPFGASPDPARLAAQVITGVGFLGAGTILREGPNVKGLTTAASLWSVACLGIAAGAGYYIVALIGMVFIFITLTLFETIQNKLIKPKPVRRYALDSANAGETLRALGELADKCKVEVTGLRAENLHSGCRITFQAEFPRGKKWPRVFFEGLTDIPSVRVASIIDEATVTA